MAKYHRGYEDINVRLLNFVGEDLGRQCVMFGNIGEFYEGINQYNPEDPRCIKIVDEIINGKTFPKYAFYMIPHLQVQIPRDSAMMELFSP